MVVSGDIKQAFLQIRVREGERDALGGDLEYHLDSWSKKYPEEVERFRCFLYVEDILTGGTNVKQAQQRKAMAIEIMDDAKYESHKQNSNAPELEDKTSQAIDERSYAKQQSCVKPSESKLLGLKSNKEVDTIAVEFPSDTPVTSKRELLTSLAKVNDPLGLASPIASQGKLIFRDVCDSKIGWEQSSREHPEALGKVHQVPT